MKRWFTLLSQTTILGIVIALAWAALHVDTIHGMSIALDERNEYQRRFDELQSDVRSLQQEREALARGGFSAERRLRERFLLARDNEEVILLDVGDSDPVAESFSEPDDNPTANVNILPPSMRAAQESDQRTQDEPAAESPATNSSEESAAERRARLYGYGD